MSSEDWQTILRSMHDAEESQNEKKRAEAQAKVQEEVNSSKEISFIEKITEEEFYPLLVNLKDNIPAIKAAKHKRIVKNVEYGEAFLCLLWGEKIGMEKTERANLLPFLHELIEFQKQAEKAKAKYKQGVSVFEALFSGSTYPQPKPVSMHPPHYEGESISFLDCSYFCIELETSSKTKFFPYDPKLVIAGKEYNYVAYAENKEDVFVDIGRYLHDPFHMGGYLKPNEISVHDSSNNIITISALPEDKIDFAEEIPGVLIENVIHDKRQGDQERRVWFGLRNFDCYSSNSATCN